NLLYSKPIELTIEAVPKGTMPLNKPQEITFILGPGKHTTSTGEMKVSALNPGELFCVNALDGLSPRAHQVRPGETTSFIFHVTNLQKKTRKMSVQFPQTDLVGGWRVQLAGGTTESVKPGETVGFGMKVTAPRTASPGDRHEFTVTLESDGKPEATSTVAVEATDVRNIYYWSVDSMDPEYLSLDKEGTAQGKEGDWLMPNMRAFINDSANYTQARCYLPSATDMNHTNALAGTYTGTEGVYMVGGTFRGFSEHDETLSGPNTVAHMKYGPDGKPLERMYEVAKQQTGGKSVTGFWSNKNWLAEMEGEKSVDIVGTSESWPLFYSPPYQYKMAGDPKSDTNKNDPASVSVRACFHSDNASSVMIPTMLGQFDLIGGTKLLSVPLGSMFGKTPGLHAEDRYIAGEFFRSIDEEDPDVSYVNIGDLDNTGHFTGSSWDLSEFSKGNGPSPAWDKDKYSPDMRRDDALDICREADILFGQFVSKLKARGVYDNSTIVFLSDHGMENMKDPKSGYQVLDLRDILRDNGLVRHEDYEEIGGTELNNIWSKDPAKLAKIQKILEDYTVDDPILGKVKPLNVVNREEAKNGKDYGKFGKVLPGELYSDYWVNNPDSSEGGQIWPDLFIFPLYNYQVVAHGDALASGINNVGLSFGINVPESVKFGLPAAHGGLQTTHIPLVFKAPAGAQNAPAPGATNGSEVEIGDIAPTIYNIMGWTTPACVDGEALPAK
ncbi:MAG: alkaline phosphatase family protein, partial [Candidatus Geothermincolia bacterium]